jgi:tripartite ATP-independent transporter DctM subunit
MFSLMIGVLFFAGIGVPLAFALGAASIVYLLLDAPQFLSVIPQRIWSGAYSYTLIAMPMFVLMGELMSESGITQRLISFCMYMVRPIRGGLGEVNVIASMIFGGISGSSVADTSALGSVLIPAMEEQGYPPRFSAGITVASSTMGMVIPPSLPMITFSMLSGASIGALFMAGLIPGILVGIFQTILCYVISVKKGYHPKLTPFVFTDFAKTMLFSLPSVLMPLVVIVTVSFGVCTASESAAMAVLYALILGFFVYRQLTIQAVIAALRRTVLTTASIMLIIGFSTIFTWIMTIQNVPVVIGEFFAALNAPVWTVLLAFDIMILILGTFLDVSPALLMLTPILLPVMRAIGVSDLQFGAMMIIGLAIGLVTPPVGMCLNVCNKINGMPIVEIAKGAAPFVVCNIIVLVLTSFIPAVSLWIPKMLGY